MITPFNAISSDTIYILNSVSIYSYIPYIDSLQFYLQSYNPYIIVYNPTYMYAIAMFVNNPPFLQLFTRQLSSWFDMDINTGAKYLRIRCQPKYSVSQSVVSCFTL